MEFFDVQQASRATGISPHTLRYYERIGLLVTERNKNGSRRYSQNDLGWLNILRCLRETGMPIQTMQQYAQLVQEKAHPSQMQNLLETHRKTILKNMEQQKQFLAVIETKIGAYRRHAATSAG
jgi:DNA-binding transcriptional MerR regulator